MAKRKLDASRAERFSQKLAELEDRLEFLKSNLGEEKEFLNDRILRKAMYKEFQELAEIVSDLSAMLVRDESKTVEDDYSNLEKVSKILSLDKSCADELKRANGLRNVLIHEYNGIIDKQAYESIGAVLEGICVFGKALRKWQKE
jgi:uncharacterized protein YutE (UPF0331/DUF86 family)